MQAETLEGAGVPHSRRGGETTGKSSLAFRLRGVVTSLSFGSELCCRQTRHVSTLDSANGLIAAVGSSGGRQSLLFIGG